MTQPPSPALAQELEKAATMVVTARRLLATGTTLDLSALEGKIRNVCESVVHLPHDQGQGMIPALEKLIDDLDRLAAAVCERMEPPPPSPTQASPAEGDV